MVSLTGCLFNEFDVLIVGCFWSLAVINYTTSHNDISDILVCSVLMKDEVIWSKTRS